MVVDIGKKKLILTLTHPSTVQTNVRQTVSRLRLDLIKREAQQRQRSLSVHRRIAAPDQTLLHIPSDTHKKENTHRCVRHGTSTFCLFHCLRWAAVWSGASPTSAVAWSEKNAREITSLKRRHRTRLREGCARQEMRWMRMPLVVMVKCSLSYPGGPCWCEKLIDMDRAHLPISHSSVHFYHLITIFTLTFVT